MMSCSGTHVLLETRGRSLVHSAATKKQRYLFLGYHIPHSLFFLLLCHICLFQPSAVPIAIIYKWACFHEFSKSAKQHGTATWKSSHVPLFKKKMKHVKTKSEKKGKHNLSCFGMFWTSKHQFSTIQCPFRAQQLPLGKPGDASLLLCSTRLTQAGAVIGRNIV